VPSEPWPVRRNRLAKVLVAMAMKRNYHVGQSCPWPGSGEGDSRSTSAAANRIYLDFNASTPLAPEVVAAMTPYLTEGVWQSVQHALGGRRGA
jgi:hypothetical protein